MPPECVAVADCVVQLHLACGVATCENGKCGLEIIPGPIPLQARGDSKVVECDGAGNLITKEDAGDFYTGIDCGGAYAPCIAGTGCGIGADCDSGVCSAGKCALSTCFVCGFSVSLGPIPSQLRGDCKVMACNEARKLVPEEDETDFYDDGKSCTEDACTAEGSVNTPLKFGHLCPEGKGACYGGRCVECVSDEDCSDPMVQ